MELTATDVLLIHDGELTDLRQLLNDMKVSFTERVGAPQATDQSTGWKVVVGTSRRVLELQLGATGVKPTRIALISGDSRTLLAMLRRSGVDLMVRRPVHPAALRLLLLHALYQGPEKRRHPRITIGAPIRFRAGLRRPTATLADLSLRGCRLLTPHTAKREQKIKVQLPASLGCEKPLAIEGRVVRAGPTEVGGERLNAVAVSFSTVTAKASRALKQILQAHVRGPATLSQDDASHAASTGDAAAEAAAAPDAKPAAGEAAPPAASNGSTPEEQGERRESPRHTIDRRIIALGVEAARVLIGRDISLGGMRVEPNESIDVGDALRIALHVRARQEPLVVEAVVDRDDGDEGMLLRFEELPEQEKTYLQKMVNFLPILAARGGDEGSGVIVSEILERTDTDTELRGTA